MDLAMWESWSEGRILPKLTTRSTTSRVCGGTTRSRWPASRVCSVRCGSVCVTFARLRPLGKEKNQKRKQHNS